MTAEFNVTNFRAQFPEFANSTTYPDASLAAWWEMGNNYVSTDNAGYDSWRATQAQLACDLMCAHLAKSFTLIGNGVGTVLVNGSTEGSVSVSLTPPPVRGAWQWWLATTGYGAQLRALLKVIAGPGSYIGGLPERSAFRKVGGVW